MTPQDNKCLLCSRVQVDKTEAMLEVCLSVMNPLQIAVVREAWEATCSLRGWDPYSVPVLPSEVYHLSDH
jgi:hypothetical protein